MTPLGVRSTSNGLRDTVFVASLVVLVVLGQVDLKLSGRVCGAGHTLQGCLTAAGTELLVHLLYDVEACVAAEHLCVDVFDTLHVC